ncbi:MAG: tetratricopeptide repeat protein, partial [Burkholderiales bacterium]
MTGVATRLGLVVATLAFGGCASRADLISQERRLQSQLSEQRKQIQSIQREVERLRGDVEGGSPRAGGGADRVTELEDRLKHLEGKQPPGEEATDTTAPPPDRTATVTPAPPVPVAPPPPAEDAWQRDVSRDQQVIAASNAAERGDLTPIMDSVARKDCGRAVPQLNSFASQKKESPLASSALYWAARCYALKGDRNQAIAKFYDVVTKYPKGSKAPAALWEQGNLF